MANAIVVIVVIIIMLFAGKGAYKHLKGEGACCGGGSKPEIPKKKLDGTKLGEKTMKITGMHCENCVASVTRAINRIDGAAAKVSLKKGEAVRISRSFYPVKLYHKNNFAAASESADQRRDFSAKCLKIFRLEAFFCIKSQSCN